MGVPGSAAALLFGQPEESGYAIERSLRFNDDDTAYLSKAFASTGDRQKWTWAGWAKRSSADNTTGLLFHVEATVSTYAQIGWSGDNFQLSIAFNQSTFAYIRAAAESRDVGAWAHYVVVYDSANATSTDRMILYINGVRVTDFVVSLFPSQNASSPVNIATTHYIGTRKNINQYFDGYLADVHFIDGQALAATDFGEYDDSNVWQPKKFAGTYGTNGFKLDFSDTSSNAALGTDTSGNGNTWTVNNLNAGAAAVDYSAMTTNVNASAIGSAFSNSTPNTGAVVGSWGAGSGPTTFTPTGGITVSSSLVVYYGVYDNNPRTATLTITYNDATTETDTFTSGTGNWMGSFTASNAAGKTIQSIKVVYAGGYQQFGGFVVDGTALLNSAAVITDALRDSPTNGDPADDTGVGGEVVGNYATLNPLHKGLNASLSNGNLDCVSSSPWGTTISTIGVSAGKWYAELTISGSISYPAFGVSTLDLAYTGSFLGQQAGSYCWYANSGSGLYTGGAYTNRTSTWATDCSVGDVIALALDMDNGTLKYYKNGSLVGGGNAFTGITGTQFFATCSAGHTESWNFGQRAFAYTAPSGYKALCTANLPEPTIADGSKYFDTILWTGQGNTNDRTLATTTSADLVWTKSRSNAYHHALFDTVRGFSENALNTDNTNSEGTASGGYLKSTTDTTITLAATSDNSNAWYNGSSHTYVAWAWDAGDATTTIAAGSLNSSAYDQSQTWSNGKDADRVDYPVTNVFDASLTTVGYGAVNQTITVTLPGGSIALTSLRVRAERVGTATGKFYVNGNDYTSQIASGTNWNTITGETSITSIGYASDTGSNFVGLYAVEVNGKQLIDSGVTVPNAPSIASTVRANPSAGFSITGYLGTQTSNSSFAHGLNTPVEFVIAKNLAASEYWMCWHKDVAEYHGNDASVIFLNVTNGSQAGGANNANYYPTAPDSNVVYVGNSSNTNSSTSPGMIAYCFASVEGYSAISSFTSQSGNNFVYVGFRPTFLLVKKTVATADSAYEGWIIFDSERGSYNINQESLFANSSQAEGLRGNGSSSIPTTFGVDFLSNGFAFKDSSTEYNRADPGTYIFYAVAESPFKTARAR